VIESLRRGQRFQRGYIGVALQSLDESVATALGVPKDRGELIQSVTPGGPAARAGVQQGDVVVSVGGRPVTPDESLAYLISQQPVGARIPLELIRDGRRQTVTVTTTQRPTVEELARISGVQPEQELTEAPREQQSTSQRSARASLGVTVQTLTPEIARSLNLRDATVRGVVVTSVDQSSDAGQKLQTGDIIQSINQRRPARRKKRRRHSRQHALPVGTPRSCWFAAATSPATSASSSLAARVISSQWDPSTSRKSGHRKRSRLVLGF
jgi:serine protease Do